jgi:hypothetical protein
VEEKSGELVIQKE